MAEDDVVDVTFFRMFSSDSDTEDNANERLAIDGAVNSCGDTGCTMSTFDEKYGPAKIAFVST